MERQAIIGYECRQPIVAGEDLVRCKVPGEGVYHCFHRRCRAEDCWEIRLKQGIESLLGFMGSKRMCSWINRSGDCPLCLKYARGDVYARREKLFGF